MLDQLEPQHKILNLADICGKLDNAKFGDFKILMKSLSKRNSGKVSFKQEKIASNRDFIHLVDHRNGPPDEKTIINFSTYFGERTRSGDQKISMPELIYLIFFWRIRLMNSRSEFKTFDIIFR